MVKFKVFTWGERLILTHDDIENMAASDSPQNYVAYSIISNALCSPKGKELARGAFLIGAALEKQLQLIKVADTGNGVYFDYYYESDFQTARAVNQGISLEQFTQGIIPFATTVTTK